MIRKVCGITNTPPSDGKAAKKRLRMAMFKLLYNLKCAWKRVSQFFERWSQSEHIRRRQRGNADQRWVNAELALSVAPRPEAQPGDLPRTATGWRPARHSTFRLG